MYLVAAAGIFHPKPCVPFPILFFEVLLTLSYRQGKFCIPSVIRSSEAASRCFVKKVFLKISQISPGNTCVGAPF